MKTLLKIMFGALFLLSMGCATYDKKTVSQTHPDGSVTKSETTHEKGVTVPISVSAGGVANSGSKRTRPVIVNRNGGIDDTNRRLEEFNRKTRPQYYR